VLSESTFEESNETVDDDLEVPDRSAGASGVLKAASLFFALILLMFDFFLRGIALSY
jgi:hypothetical protein